jgi:hypothetical protein
VAEFFLQNTFVKMPATLDELNTFFAQFFAKHALDVHEKWMAPSHQKSAARMLKGKRVIRDPDEPKRGRSGWQLFLENQRPVIKAEKPDVMPKDVLTISSKRWRAMDDKSHWDLLSNAEVSRQSELIMAYKRQRTEEVESADAAVSESVTKSVTESVTESATESVTESVIESVSESVAESVK